MEFHQARSIMSTKIYDAYLYDKSEDDLILELNAIRDAYMEYLKADIKKDPNKWMRMGAEEVDRKKVPEGSSLSRACRYIEFGMHVQERGNPLDVSGCVVVVKHQGKIVLWFFPGWRFEQFAKQNEILQRIRKNEYWWLDSADCEWDTEEEEAAYDKRGDFWHSAFERFHTWVPSRMGLVYEFFTHEDIFRVGDFLHMEYEAYLKRCAAPGTEEKTNGQVLFIG